MCAQAAAKDSATVPKLASFLETHPKLRLEVVMDDRSSTARAFVKWLEDLMRFRARV